MGDFDKPQPLLTPTVKSTLPCDMRDPLLTLTPQKPSGLSHLKHANVRVERHLPVSNGDRTNILNDQKRSTSLKNNVRKGMVAKKKVPSKTKLAKDSVSKLASQVKHCVRIDEHCDLKLPKCNSTAIMGHNLDLLDREQFDSNAAVMEAIKQSEKTRSSFAEKVAEGVNRPLEERKYSGLIAVDVPIEKTITQAMEDKMTKIKGPSCDKKISKVPDGPAPDILEAFHPDMIVEEPCFDIPTFPQNDPELEKAPADMAFSLYKHMRCWHSM